MAIITYENKTGVFGRDGRLTHIRIHHNDAAFALFQCWKGVRGGHYVSIKVYIHSFVKICYILVSSKPLSILEDVMI